mmetsp:Transcript_141083/g.245916  ORF Transcript_141083/g.245916 Transcript_141083/m.245916 type:complete len:200 (+) Transcript_141083:272-871(+)
MEAPECFIRLDCMVIKQTGESSMQENTSPGGKRATSLSSLQIGGRAVGRLASTGAGMMHISKMTRSPSWCSVTVADEALAARRQCCRPRPFDRVPWALETVPLNALDTKSSVSGVRSGSAWLVMQNTNPFRGWSSTVIRMSGLSGCPYSLALESALSRMRASSRGSIVASRSVVSRLATLPFVRSETNSLTLSFCATVT